MNDDDDIAGNCTPACWEMPECTVCHRTKGPRGRSVPLAAANGYCGYDCKGYDADPKPGHYWPSEEPEKEAAAWRRSRKTP